MEQGATLLLVSFGAALLGCAAPEGPTAPPSEPAAPVARWEGYVEAINAGNAEEVLAFYTEDAVFEIPGVGKLRGTEQLRGLADWDAANHTHVRAEGYTVRGNVLTIAAVAESNDWFRAIGVEESRYRPGTRIVFRGDRLAEVHLAPETEESAKAVDEAWAPFLAWASRHPERPLEMLLPKEGFVYSRESAERWQAWFAKWRAAQAGEAPEPE